jgi:hypothetical protein
MKPILRALLVVDGIITLILGLALVASPWANTIVALQAVAPQPPALGQLFGITLLGLAWLQLHAAYDGQLTITVARVSGHIGWISGIVLLVWLIALHSATVDTNRAFVFSGPAIAIVLLVVGLGLVRLAAAVRRRNLQLAAGATSAENAERAARKTRGAEREREIERERAASRGIDAEPSMTHPDRAEAKAGNPWSATPARAVDPAAAPVRTVVDPATGQERVVHEHELHDPRDPRVTLPPDEIRRPL